MCAYHLEIAPAQQKIQIAREAQHAVAPFFPNNQMKFPSETLIVAAQDIAQYRGSSPTVREGAIPRR